VVKKAWSANSGIIRAADGHHVQKWLPSAGFAPEGHVLRVEEKSLSKAEIKTEPMPAKSNPPMASASGTLPAVKPASLAQEVSLTPEEEALVSVSALRLLPDELERIREQAFREGEAEGKEKGRLEGIEEGKKLVESTFEQRVKEEASTNIKAAQAPLLELLHTIHDDVPKLDTTLAQHILDLSLVLAQQMTCHAIHFNKKNILAVLEDAIGVLPREARGWLQIYVHPEDGALLREALEGHPYADEQRILDDDGIQRGGCRLASRIGELDATLEGRWKTLLKNLGRDDKWFIIEEE
jgi:flagellar assembly protein FliH